MAPIGCAAIYSNPELMKQLSKCCRSFCIVFFTFDSVLKFDYVHYPPAKVMSPEEIQKQMDYNRQMLKQMLEEEAAAEEKAKKETKK